MRDGGAVMFVAEDQEYVDRILPLAERLPALRRIVVVDATAMFAYHHESSSPTTHCVEAGRDCRSRLAGAASRQA